MLPVSRRLGHSSLGSLDPYIDANIEISNSSLEAKHRKEILAKDVALHEAKTTIARLEAAASKIQAKGANEAKSAEGSSSSIRRGRGSSRR